LRENTSAPAKARAETISLFRRPRLRRVGAVVFLQGTAHCF
jgi:hypothetical protein